MKDTIARWFKKVLHDAGINTGVFKPHSVRAASVSKANKLRQPSFKPQTGAKTLH